MSIFTQIVIAGNHFGLIGKFSISTIVFSIPSNCLISLVSTIFRIYISNQPHLFIMIIPSNIIEITPIYISTLISSVVIALVTVFFTINLQQKIAFINSKNGVISEMKRNNGSVDILNSRVNHRKI